MISMKEFENELTKPLNNQQQVVHLYKTAILARILSPRDSAKIITLTFNATHPTKLNFQPSHNLKNLRFELGALKAPGHFSTYLDHNFTNQEDFEDFLWNRLEKMADSLLADSL